MCQELQTTITHNCGHIVEEKPTMIPYENCGGCGQVRKTERLGKSTKKTPCPDCIERKTYVKIDGKWQRAANA
jgi:hypothetical protein